VSWLLFDGVLRPIELLTIYNDRLASKYWVGPLIIAVVLGFVISRKAIALLRVAIFVACSMTISVGLVWVIVGVIRAQEIRRVHPDLVQTHSFLKSLQDEPHEFQFFLHAAAWKDCRAYAWSYREMRFYELSAGVVQNVMPWTSAKAGCPRSGGTPR
jgi:hypothetical protein